jgi:hypothetical protein
MSWVERGYKAGFLYKNSTYRMIQTVFLFEKTIKHKRSLIMKRLLIFCLAVNTMFVYANNQNTKAKPTFLKPLKSSMVEKEAQVNQLPASNRYAGDTEPITPIVKKEKKQYMPSGKELDRLNKLKEEEKQALLKLIEEDKRAQLGKRPL